MAINCYCFFAGEGAGEEGSVVKGLPSLPMWPSFSEALPGVGGGGGVPCRPSEF